MQQVADWLEKLGLGHIQFCPIKNAQLLRRANCPRSRENRLLLTRTPPAIDESFKGVTL